METLDTAMYSPNDFEFIKRSGHVFRVPNCAPGFQFNADALKTLSGQGDVYVRLTRDIPKQVSAPSSIDWSDDSDFETPQPVATQSIVRSSTEDSNNVSTAPKTLECNSTLHSATDHESDNIVDLTSDSSSLAPLQVSGSQSPSPTTKKLKCDSSVLCGSSYTDINFDQMYQMFIISQRKLLILSLKLRISIQQKLWIISLEAYVLMTSLNSWHTGC